jgi:hypothetical protein
LHDEEVAAADHVVPPSFDRSEAIVAALAVKPDTVHATVPMPFGTATEMAALSVALLRVNPIPEMFAR